MFKNFLILFASLFILACSTTKESSVIHRTSSIIRVSEQADKIQQIFLVRHAEKGSDGTSDPALNVVGLTRAKRLADHLRAAGITKIYSTDYKRTKQTAEPLAKLLGIKIELYETDLIDITTVLKAHKNGNVLVVGHSNTTPKLMNNLLGLKRFENLDEKDYDNLFVLSCFEDKVSSTVLKF